MIKEDDPSHLFSLAGIHVRAESPTSHIGRKGNIGRRPILERSLCSVCNSHLLKGEEPPAAKKEIGGSIMKRPGCFEVGGKRQTECCFNSLQLLLHCPRVKMSETLWSRDLEPRFNPIPNDHHSSQMIHCL